MGQTLYRDFLFLTLMAFVIMVLIMIPFLNPPTKKNQGEVAPPGNVIAHIVWDEGNIDVDLWVFGPGEVKPVGYSNKGGLVWNLLRDDLGHTDSTNLNYEFSYSRGVLAGEYIINVHCFRCPPVPVDVSVEISVNTGKTDGKKPVNVIAKTHLQLMPREELTAFRFKLTKEGKLVPGSLNHIYKALRSGSGYQTY